MSTTTTANLTPPSSPSNITNTTTNTSRLSSPPRRLRHPPRTVLPATTSPQSFSTLHENLSSSSLDLPRLRRRPRASSGASALSVASSSGSRQTDYSYLGLSRESLSILENSEGNGVVVGVVRRVRDDTRKRGLRRVKGDVAEVRKVSGEGPLIRERPVTSDGRDRISENRRRNALPTPESSPSPGEREVVPLKPLHHPRPYRMPERRIGEGDRRSVSEGSALRSSQTVQRDMDAEDDEEDGGAPLNISTQPLSAVPQPTTPEQNKDAERRINIIVPETATTASPITSPMSPPLIAGFTNSPQFFQFSNKQRPQPPNRKDSENYTPTTPFPNSEDETLARHVSNKLPPRARIITPPKRMNSEVAEVMRGDETVPGTPAGQRDIGSVIAQEFGLDKPLKMRTLAAPYREEERLSMELSSSPEVKEAVLVRMGTEKGGPVVVQSRSNSVKRRDEQAQKVVVPPIDGPSRSNSVRRREERAEQMQKVVVPPIAEPSRSNSVKRRDEQVQRAVVPPVEEPRSSAVSLADVDPRIRSSSIAKRRLSLTIPGGQKKPVVEIFQAQKPQKPEVSTLPTAQVAPSHQAPPPPPPQAPAAAAPQSQETVIGPALTAGQTSPPIGLSKAEAVNTRPSWLTRRTTSSSNKNKALPTPPPTSHTSGPLIPTTATQQPPPALPTPKTNPTIFIHTPREPPQKPAISRSSTARSSRSTKSTTTTFAGFTVPSLPRFNFIPATPLPLMSPSAALQKQLGEPSGGAAPPDIIHEENEAASDSDTCSTCSSSDDENDNEGIDSPTAGSTTTSTAAATRRRPRRPRPRPMSPQYRNSKLHPWWRPRSVHPGDEALRRALSGTPSKFTENSAGVGPEYFSALENPPTNNANDGWVVCGGGLVRVDKKRKVIGIGGVRVEWVGLGGLWGRVTGSGSGGAEKKAQEEEEKRRKAEEARRKKEADARKKKEGKHRQWEKLGQEVVRGRGGKGKEVQQPQQQPQQQQGQEQRARAPEEMVAGGTRKINLKRKGWF